MRVKNIIKILLTGSFKDQGLKKTYLIHFLKKGWGDPETDVALNEPSLSRIQLKRMLS
jgi:hypothetical protein